MVLTVMDLQFFAGHAIDASVVITDKNLFPFPFPAFIQKGGTIRSVIFLVKQL